MTNKTLYCISIIIAVSIIVCIAMTYPNNHDPVIDDDIQTIESFDIVDPYSGSSVNGSIIRFNHSGSHSDISLMLNFYIAPDDFGGLCIDSTDVSLESILSSYQDDPLHQNTSVQNLEDHTTIYVGRNLYSTESPGGGGTGLMIAEFNILDHSDSDATIEILITIGSKITDDGRLITGTTDIMLFL